MTETYERMAVWVVAAVFVVSVVGVGYVATSSQETGDPYTEMYVLGTEGNASNYPTDLSVGETGTVTVGVGNHEHRQAVYTVVVSLGNRTAASHTLRMDAGETWEGEFSFAPTTTGDQRLWIRLYRGQTVTQSDQAYRTLRLWLTVSD